jgi:hypothetical protein
MSDKQRGSNDYHEIVEGIRQLARQTPIAEIKQELFELADRLERLGNNKTKKENNRQRPP